MQSRAASPWGRGLTNVSLGDAAVVWTEQRQVCTPGRLGSSRNFVPRLVQPAVPQVCVREDRHGRESNVTCVTMVTSRGTGVSQRDRNPRGPRRGVCRPSRRHAGHSTVRSCRAAPEVLWVPLFVARPPSPGDHAPSTAFMFLPFPECHGVEVAQRAAFADWLLSLSRVHRSLLHLFFSWLAAHLFLVPKDIPFSGATQFVYPSPSEGRPSVGSCE